MEIICIETDRNSNDNHKIETIPIMLSIPINKYEHELINLDSSSQVNNSTLITTDIIVYEGDFVREEFILPSSIRYMGEIYLANNPISTRDKDKLAQMMSWQENTEIEILDGLEYVATETSNSSIVIAFYRGKSRKSVIQTFVYSVFNQEGYQRIQQTQEITEEIKDLKDEIDNTIKEIQEKGGKLFERYEQEKGEIKERIQNKNFFETIMDILKQFLGITNDRYILEQYNLMLTDLKNDMNKAKEIEQELSQTGKKARTWITNYSEKFTKELSEQTKLTQLKKQIQDLDILSTIKAQDKIDKFKTGDYQMEETFLGEMEEMFLDEREKDITEIAESAKEVNKFMKRAALLVKAQQPLIDKIDTNVSKALLNAIKGVEEFTKTLTKDTSLYGTTKRMIEKYLWEYALKKFFKILIGTVARIFGLGYFAQMMGY